MRFMIQDTNTEHIALLWIPNWLPQNPPTLLKCVQYTWNEMPNHLDKI
jgi:hypothetical protein